jgi:hypothetical protein
MLDTAITLAFEYPARVAWARLESRVTRTTTDPR